MRPALATLLLCGACQGAAVPPTPATREPPTASPTPPPSAAPPPHVAVRTGKVTAATLRVRLAHADWLGALAWSPDGARIVTGDDAGAVRVWDARTGLPVHDLARHDRRISALTWSPDGARIAVAGLTDLRVWDATTGALLHRLPGHEDIIVDIRFAGDELHVVDLRNALRRWDLRTGAALATQPVPTIHKLSLALDPTGRTLALGGYGDLELLDLPAATRRFELQMPRCDQHPDDLLCAAWKPARIEEFGHEDGQPSSHIETRPRWYVQDLAFTADGSKLLFGRADGVAVLIDVADGRPLARFTVGEDHAAAVALTADGTTAALANRDGLILLADIADRTTLRVAHEPGQSIAGLSFAPDAAALAVAGPGQAATIWDLTR